MKKFLICVGLFSLSLILLTGGIEYMLRRVPNSFVYKRQLMEQKGDRIKTCILGNSVVDYGINPAFLGDSTYNLALSGQWFRFNQCMLEQYIDKMPNLKNVIWGIASYALWVDDVDEVDVVYHQIYMDMGQGSHLLPTSELIRLRGYALRKWSKYYVAHGVTMHCDSLGFDHSYLPERRGKYWREDIPGLVRHQCSWKDKDKNGDLYRANIRRMHEMARLCQERGIHLYLVVPPVHPAYYRLADKAQLTLIHEAMADVAARWSNVDCLDYLGDSRFDDDDFYDGNHLNSTVGANKFSKILKADLSAAGYD